jgi:hypothetical protein
MHPTHAQVVWNFEYIIYFNGVKLLKRMGNFFFFENLLKFQFDKGQFLVKLFLD